MRRFRFSIRALMIVIAMAGLATWLWAVVDHDLLLCCLKLGPMVFALLVAWVWTIAKIYGSRPEQQTPSIISLIALVIATVSMPLWPLLLGHGYQS